MPTVVRYGGYGLGYYSAWMFQVTTESSNAELFLMCSSPNDALLTPGQVGDVLSALESEISGLDGVTDVTQSPVSVTGGNPQPWPSNGGPEIAFDDTWAMWGYNITGPEEWSGTPSQAWLASSAPEDGNWDAATVLGVAGAVQSAFAGISGVAACDMSARPGLSPSGI